MTCLADRQFQYDLARVQGFDVLFSVYLTIGIFGFTAIFLAVQLISTSIVLAAIVLVIGLVGYFVGFGGTVFLVVKRKELASFFEKKYGLMP